VPSIVIGPIIARGNSYLKILVKIWSKTKKSRPP